VLRPDEIDRSYDVYEQVRGWLKASSIHLWVTALPKEKFIERQKRGELFGLFEGCELAVILAIVHDSPTYWQDEIGSAPEWWFSTIATAPNFRGRKLGELAIAMAIIWLGEQKVRTVYLDCARGFLPAFYQRCGFSRIAEKNVTFPSGNTYPLVLMKKEIVAS
jgi:GNAT superfamily N-acetyltransferase